MSWVGRRVDHLASAAFGGVGGLGFSQAPAFTQAYLQRLGGHVDEARLTLERVESGALMPWLAPADRTAALAELQVRLDELVELQSRLQDTPALMRPLAMLRQGEWSIAERAAGDFVPAVPLDPASLVWTGIGIVAAVILYELLCRAPIGLVRWRKDQRARADMNAASGVRAKRSR